ncbi:MULTISPECIES: SDR family oxidoreductase [unclassified Mycobacterium]|uniref:SDR family NAD(P)-dependent oxidoreductase n=1 Tax=unclassified Mycobacterium TaxID=2642494 RepID=UPI000740482B|nr:MULTISPECIES: SDR family oxidoreductase [unclassified Mycobacterium]KUH85529.1 short-chain dehydrogenase [Mycobacterium sp. GA-1999]KUH91387.1 short-chain dehydrogenase [Mycobacterium sp. GA-0227b]KUH96358.1 short-chain dehydrogenase [Mycobacterium sp. IS-1556]
MESLRDKVAVVTGGGSGIGRAAALSLSRRGASIVVADVNPDRAASVAEEIRDQGARSISVPCDVADEDSFESLRDVVLDQFGRVDVVMNNVGVLTRGLPEHLPLTEWQRIMNINLMSYVRSNIAFLPTLLDQGSGHIVNTASFAGLFTYSYDRLPYAVSKAGVIQLSEGLRLYLAPRGIGVTVLCPGPVITNIIESLPPSFGPEPEMRGPGTQFALLTPEEVGEQVAEAILSDTFMVYTHPQVRDVLVSRASDWNAFIDERTRTI